MARRSNKSIAEILAQPLQASSKNENELLEKKINMATEGFARTKICELILRDRNRLSSTSSPPFILMSSFEVVDGTDPSAVIHR
ncbi:MAG TPA: hypothetical protein VEL11_06125 [Candidatus Bathyarchaeia archaeon]|nr:hypothetical protein [Candidatus Bathyarchaeia archaeon]